MKKPCGIRHVFLQSLSGRSTTGTLIVGNQRFKCALGRSGLRALKREGDGATPIGTFTLRQALYRADRLRRPRTALPTRLLRRDDGWCDAVGDRNYNLHVRLPYPASAETMWRADHLYDLVVVMSHNERPRAQGLGSAIFLHLAREGYEPTAGCLALRQKDRLMLLSRLGRRSDVRLQIRRGEQGESRVRSGGNARSVGLRSGHFAPFPHSDLR
jgi:L,D-peptidoglycan transpeptidase YkuD (ErfK/YbiS/YcfS/YnhG family)